MCVVQLYILQDDIYLLSATFSENVMPGHGQQQDFFLSCVFCTWYLQASAPAGKFKVEVLMFYVCDFASDMMNNLLTVSAVTLMS